MIGASVDIVLVVVSDCCDRGLAGHSEFGCPNSRQYMMMPVLRYHVYLSNTVSPPMSSSNHPHPFAHSRSLIEIIPDRIDVEEESRAYDDLCVSKIYIYIHIHCITLS